MLAAPAGQMDLGLIAARRPRTGWVRQGRRMGWAFGPGLPVGRRHSLAGKVDQTQAHSAARAGQKLDHLMVAKAVQRRTQSTAGMAAQTLASQTRSASPRLHSSARTHCSSEQGGQTPRCSPTRTADQRQMSLQAVLVGRTPECQTRWASAPALTAGRTPKSPPCWCFQMGY